MIWATDIQSKPSHLHDELILRCPPVPLIHLFTDDLGWYKRKQYFPFYHVNRISIGLVDSIIQQLPVIRENLQKSVDL